MEKSMVWAGLKFHHVSSDKIIMKCILDIKKCLLQRLTRSMEPDSHEGYDEFIGYEAFCERCIPHDLSPQYRKILLSEKPLPWVIKG